MDRPLSVSELTQDIKQVLEAGFSRLWLEGEISNFRPASSGHWYFTLKDDDSVISACLFRNRQSAVSFRPEEGMKVTVRGNLDLYAKRGSYQIICESMEQAGRGQILLTLEERKRRLAAEGLFDPAHKQSLPLFPKRVVVITSPTGAAIRDILQVLQRRAAGLDVVVLPAAVQGAEAAPALAIQLGRAQRYRMGDVIILGRGGGSLEDMLPFSEEILVRAVAACSIPVISAVGHEIDTCLCDLAADLRAPTPSAAAEMVVQSRAELQQRVLGAGQLIIQAWKAQLRNAKQTIKPFTPGDLERSFQVFLQPRMQALDDAKEGLLDGMDRLLRDWRHRLDKGRHALEALSPGAVLERGYAVVSRQDHILESAAQAGTLAAGSEIQIRWHDGQATAALGAVTSAPQEESRK